MSTPLRAGKKVTRRIDIECIDAPVAIRRAMLVTITRAGIEFRAAGRRGRHLLPWAAAIARFPDLRRELR